jgi:uncharacterized protein YecE (DUF72 family)
MGADRDIRVGCCGFIVSQKEYFELFNLVEIQQTFYQLPRIQTAEKWGREAPEGFEFTLKAWQLITHEAASPTYRRLGRRIPAGALDRYGCFRLTPEVEQAWEQTSAFAQILGAAAVVFQCPASFRPTEQNVSNMREFFTKMERGDFRFAWEPRGSWPDDLVHRLCSELELIHCVDPFKKKPQYGDLQYFRLHGITGYAYHYSDSDLNELKRWVEKGSSYVLFNNNWMKEDALRFSRMIHPDGSQC